MRNLGPSRSASSRERLLKVASPHLGRYSAGNIDVKLLFEALARQHGVEVVDYDISRLRRGDFGVVHVHWPEWLIHRHSNRLITVTSAVLTALALRRAQRHGTLVVWDANNVVPHEPSHEGVLRKFLRWFARNCDVFIAVNGSLADEFLAAYPSLMLKSRRILGNRNYSNAIPNATLSSADARRTLGLPQSAKIGLLFGAVRRYKNLVTIVQAFKASESFAQGAILVIAGPVEDSELEGQLREAAAGAGTQIRLFLAMVPEQEVSAYFRAADVALIGTSQSVRSSVAPLALSLGTPVFMPARGAARDDESLLHPSAFRIFEGGLTSARIDEALDSVIPGKKIPIPVPVRDGEIGRPWEVYAEQVREMYDSELKWKKYRDNKRNCNWR